MYRWRRPAIAHDTRGAAAVEYILILVLVSLGAAGLLAGLAEPTQTGVDCVKQTLSTGEVVCAAVASNTVDPGDIVVDPDDSVVVGDPQAGGDPVAEGAAVPGGAPGAGGLAGVGGDPGTGGG